MLRERIAALVLLIPSPLVFSLQAFGSASTRFKLPEDRLKPRHQGLTRSVFFLPIGSRP